MKISLTLLSIFFLTQASFAETAIEALTKRIEKIEKGQEKHLEDFEIQKSENSSKLNSFLRDNLTIGGFFEPSYTFITGKDTEFQATNSANLLGLNLAADYSPRLKFVSQLLTGISFPIVNEHNDPRAESLNKAKRREYGPVNFGAVLTQGYLDYSISDTFVLQVGQGYAPFGYAAQQREIVLFIRRGGPQILRTTELLSPLWGGFNLSKTLDSGKNNIGLNLYSFTRLEDAKTPGLGGRISLSKKDESLITGFSVQVAKFHGKIEEIIGADLKFHEGDFVLTSEYAKHFSKRSGPWTIYLEPSLFIIQEEVLVYTFIDFSKNSFNKTITIDDPIEKYEYGTGLNWLPTSYTRLRAGFTYHNYVHANSVILGQERDYISLDLSAGVAF